jgi:hypothetical protein
MCYISAVILAAYAPKSARAIGVIPYPNTGTVNPVTYTFTAMATGDITAYFAGAGGAAYSEDLGMMVNGVAVGTEGLNNHTSSVGSSFDLGHVNAGDTVTFFIDVWTGFDFGTGTHLGNVYSDPSLNGTYDSTYAPHTGVNHVYSSFYNSATAQFPGVPSGTYVGFEDLPASNPPDYNYLDEQYVFTDVGMTANGVPDSGSTMALFGLGLTGIGLLKSAWRKNRSA